ncbi:MAG: Stk1 family PASTA domain-containing Ser/Thr kinase [Lachnospiraceae bacterium]|nr:Stk1 family PASTA domain-containing Ser/Thr kinase [Lachnospiraceae bacterium]
MIITPGMLIGDRYEIIERIGSGGMADVYKAKCHKLNRMVAIKFLKPEYCSDNTFVTNFRAEAESCAGLTHPNIVSVYDVGDEGDLHYIVMELVEGITLKRYIEKKGQLDIKEAVGIGIQIAQGLEAAHAKHVIHRDIKPQNIILSLAGKVKVADFGIAKATTSNTIRENAVGSVHYLSPEQARGGYVDERSDIYSLGITMYEMLSGRVPFVGDSNVAVALAHINGVAPSLIELNPNITPAVEKIIRKCMSKKPERRYSSAAELIADLKMSITRPDGDFVTAAAPTVSNSPTKQLSDDELKQIKNGAKAGSVVRTGNFFDEEDGDDDEDEDPRALMPAQRRRKDDRDDEDIDDVGNIWEKVGLISSILLMVAVAVIVILVVNKTTGIFNQDNKGNTLTPQKKVTFTPTPTQAAHTELMPNLVGQTQTQAVVKLKSLNLELNISTPEEANPNEKYPAGTVVSQEPLEGAELGEGDTIVLYISIGKGTIKIPSVKGKTLDQVRTILSGMNVIAEPRNDDREENIVLGTEPAEGSTVERGSTIIVYYSAGPELISVPEVIGATRASAEKQIQDAGLRVEVKEEYNEKEAGTVFDQTPGNTSEVKKGTVVTLFVSKGPEPTPTPTDTPTPTPTNTPTPTPIPTDTPTPTTPPADTPTPVGTPDQDGGNGDT